MPFLLANDSIEVLVSAGQKICVTSYGAGTAKIETATGPGNYPIAFSLLTLITNSDYTSSEFTRDTTVKITAGLCDAEYVAGSNPFPTIHRITTDSNGNILLDGNSIIEVNNSTPALRITQLGAGHALLVEDEANPDSTPFVINNVGNVGIGAAPNSWAPSNKALQIVGATSSQSVSIANDGGFYLNGYYDGANYKYVGSGVSRLFSLASGHRFYSAVSGTAGGNATYNQLMTLDDAGFLGVGITPAAGWHSGTKAIQVGTFGAVSCIIPTGFTELLNNCYNTTASSFAYSTSNAATRYSQQLGTHVWYSAPSGTAGAAATLNQVMTLNASGNLLLGTISDSGFRASLNYSVNSGPGGLRLTSATRDSGQGNISAVEIIGNSNYGRIFNIQGDGQIDIAPLGVTRFKINTSGVVFSSQESPDAVDATATLTTANLSKKIITSTTAAAVTGTLPTGTLMDGTFGTVTDLCFEWAVINTGPNAFTLAVGTGHTIVGNATVATNTSGTFKSRRTGAATWISYRI